jgi:Fur family peroxide stress response transcriptional regulator
VKNTPSIPLTEKMRQFEQLCRKQGIPLTTQRRVILENLALREDHPTADQVFEGVAPRLPGLSRTTVYRVLETLVELGVIHKASHLGSAARYDPNTDRHHHLTCLGCQKVLDLEEEAVRELAMPRATAKGFEITDYSVHFKGFCSDCLKSRKKRGNPGLKTLKSR